MGFPFAYRAKSRKGRGLFRKAPDPREIGDRFGRLLKRMQGSAVLRAAWKGERYLAELEISPLVPAISLVVGDDAELTITGDATFGPAVIADVAARMAPIFEELDFVWVDEAPSIETAQAMVCAKLRETLQKSDGRVRIGVPARKFLIDAPVLTALGPRDAAWRDGVSAEPSRARDAFPYWEPGPGRAALARALVAMWLEIPWREPLDREERDLFKQVDEDLRAARKAKLDVPWRAWQELLRHMGVEDEDVDEKAKDATDPPIGYRRHDLEAELSGGWSVRMSGAMIGHWEDDGARYWATDGDRVLEFTSLTAEEERDTDKLLAVAPEAHPVIARFAEGEQRGRAEAFEDDGVAVVVGLMARAPHVGILTCKGGERDWALATWRSLQHKD
ncbi:MAG TPA: hypothetical protein VMZ53_00660 [Kofleriaceae bacterium]|nr:hypothetical protein [Kofleriaceae bacterium]